MVGIRAADVEKALKSIMQVECWRIVAIPALPLDEERRGCKLNKEELTILLLALLFFNES